jgi:hypothetical protein
VSTSCPGALLFALALFDARDDACDAAAKTLLAGVVAGRPLNDLLDEALLTWADAAVRVSERDAESARSTWRAVTDASALERTRLLRVQRLLIRRAGAWVAPSHLWMPPPVAFAPEDIPTDRRSNALWFQTMRSHEALLYRPQTDGPRRSLALFISKHAHDAECQRWAIDRLLSLVVARDRLLQRTSSLESALGAYEQWQEKLFLRPGGAGLAQVVRSVYWLGVNADSIREVPLPPPPFPGLSGTGIAMRPLSSAGQLIDEGWQMHHCVAGRLPSVLQGHCAIYSANISGQRLTVALDKGLYGRWRLGDVRGKHNRPPSASEREVFQQWMLQAARLACAATAEQLPADEVTQ